VLAREVGSTRKNLIPAYTRADARLGWRPASRFELSVNAENLMDPRHTEFHTSGSFVVPGEQIGRSVYGRFTWRF
jgi:iron complex outermembrane receptor protein